MVAMVEVSKTRSSTAGQRERASRWRDLRSLWKPVIAFRVFGDTVWWRFRMHELNNHNCHPRFFPHLNSFYIPRVNHLTSVL